MDLRIGFARRVLLKSRCSNGCAILENWTRSDEVRGYGDAVLSPALMEVRAQFPDYLKPIKGNESSRGQRHFARGALIWPDPLEIGSARANERGN